MQEREQIVVGVDLGEREVAEQPLPGVPGIGATRAEVVHEIGRDHGHRVGGHDAAHPMPGVATHRRRCATRGGGLHPRQEQQETRQHEEDRHADLHPRIHQSDITLRVLAGGVRGMGQDDEQRCNRADPGERIDPPGRGDRLEAALRIELSGYGHGTGRLSTTAGAPSARDRVRGGSADPGSWCAPASSASPWTASPEARPASSPP